MSTIALFVVGFVALEHLYILWLEMFAWETRAPKVFGRRKEGFYAETKSMAANQGLYNGFLAAGLIWSFLITDPIWQKNVAVFFLACVAIAGIYGALSVTKRIFFVQSIPAIIGIALIYLT